ncbi:GMP synthase [Suillus discolor]|uniref:GMP synthase n=1 Tax=Suillus discolor TaxID=1912936 RepID=A0A9P7F6H5_9AGAM|nr:GMP synthase [Suillus discolor]KAG2108684.1 GMP synthase [Suillus discolor]
MAEIHDQFDTILILDFGSLMTRRCCELNVCSELMPCTPTLTNLKFKLKGSLILVFLNISMDTSSREIQEICWNHKGPVAKYDHRENGLQRFRLAGSTNRGNSVDALFEDRMQVLFFFGCHGDQLSLIPLDFYVIGWMSTTPYAAIHNPKPFYDIQFHPEICSQKGCVIGAVSGGVDRTVAAKLILEAIGDRYLGVKLTVVDTSELFLSRLDDHTFILVFETEAAKTEEAAEKEENGAKEKGKIEWLLQGTLYPDVIENINFEGPSAIIKTHHDVGGLLKAMKLKLIELLHELFKGLMKSAHSRLLLILAPSVPFPSPGLTIRIFGLVTREQVKILQQADHIYIEDQAMAAGMMGDKRTYEQVITLRPPVTLKDFMTADWYAFPPEVSHRVLSRITNEPSTVRHVASFHQSQD